MRTHSWLCFDSHSPWGHTTNPLGLCHPMLGCPLSWRGLNFIPQNSHVETLTFNVMVFGDKTFEGLDEIMKVGPHDGIIDSIKSEREEITLSLSCEDIVRRWLSASQKVCLRSGITWFNTVILNFSLSGTMRNTCLLFKPPILGYFLISAWAD